jgi:hypothetical protein
LVELCCRACINIAKNNKNIFLASDSVLFLKEASMRLDNIYFVPGRVVHMDYVKNASLDVYEKSFLDLFIMASAEKVVNIYGHGLYKSGFPAFASEIFNKNFHAINIDDIC